MNREEEQKSENRDTHLLVDLGNVVLGLIDHSLDLGRQVVNGGRHGGWIDEKAEARRTERRSKGKDKVNQDGGGGKRDGGTKETVLVGRGPDDDVAQRPPLCTARMGAPRHTMHYAL